jgi:hypothetical protein
MARRTLKRRVKRAPTSRVISRGAPGEMPRLYLPETEPWFDRSGLAACANRPFRRSARCLCWERSVRLSVRTRRVFGAAVAKASRMRALEALPLPDVHNFKAGA